MTLKQDLEKYVANTHAAQWVTHDGQKVPEAEDLGLGNEAICLDGTVLYADLADSTELVRDYKDWFAAEVYKNFLYCAARIIRWRGGSVTAYDGDRVMGVFIGGTKNTDAAKCALQINYVTTKIVQPAIKAKYPTNKLTLRHKVGIDTSKLFVARTGIRGSNDLVWVGHSANNAAKLAALSTEYSTYISEGVYIMLKDSSKYGGDPKRNMWTNLGMGALGYRIYGSTFWWSI